MALDFVGLRTEVIARGFPGLDAGAGLTRLKRWVNDAMHQVNELEDWDYLLTTTTGAAPLTISDLRSVESVVANSEALDPLDRHSLTDAFGDITLTGTPAYYYKSAPTTISVYPASTTTLTVRYFKFGPDLSGDSDAPLMPDRFRPVIIEFVGAKAYRDRENREAAADCLAEAQRILDTMHTALLHAPERQVLTGASEDL